MESGQVCCLRVAQQWCDGGGGGGCGSEGTSKMEKGSFKPCDSNGQMLNDGGSGVEQHGGGEKGWHRWNQVYFSVDNYKVQSGYLYC